VQNRHLGHPGGDVVELVAREVGLYAFKDSRGAHAAADTHRHHAVARVAALEFAHKRGREFCAGAAERVSQRNRAAIRIYPRGIEIRLLNHGQRLRRERFIQFDHRHVA